MVVKKTNTKEQLNKAKEIIRAFLDCPLSVDEATKAKHFKLRNKQHRQQMVVNFSCSFEKVYIARKFIKECEK